MRVALSLLETGHRNIGTSPDSAAGTPQRRSAPAPMACVSNGTILRGMRSTGYAVVWQDGGPPMAGRILVDASALDFDGAGHGRHASRHIPYTSIASSRLGRGAADRVGGRPALVLELDDGEVIRIATPEVGALSELAEAVKSERK